jgi:hypothetical protein
LRTIVSPFGFKRILLVALLAATALYLCIGKLAGDVLALRRPSYPPRVQFGPRLVSSSELRSGRNVLRSSKPRAEFMVLVREKQLQDLLASLRDLQWAFNDDLEHGYDYVSVPPFFFPPCAPERELSYVPISCFTYSASRSSFLKRPLRLTFKTRSMHSSQRDPRSPRQPLGWSQKSIGMSQHTSTWKRQRSVGRGSSREAGSHTQAVKRTAKCVGECFHPLFERSVLSQTRMDVLHFFHQVHVWTHLPASTPC